MKTHEMIFGAVLVCALIYGAFSLKIWKCKNLHPTASTLACLL